LKDINHSSAAEKRSMDHFAGLDVADRFGDLDAETLKVLKQAAAQEGQASAVSRNLARLDQRRFAPPPGTVLVREWDRKSHRVMVMPDGFAWNGETFDSLSEIAFAITGTNWNGPSWEPWRRLGSEDQLFHRATRHAA
jgi:Protein of unknown function (DUF2924)